MTYFGFHLRFNLPILALLGILSGPALVQPGSLAAVGLVLLAVFVFTIPWDNYAAAKGIWGFPRDRFSLQILWLPLEEYLFFAVQALQAMLLVRAICDRFGAFETIASTAPLADRAPALGLLLLGWAVAGCFLHRRARGRFHYAWHLLYWFAPVLSLQWIIGWEILLPRIAILAAVTALLGTYLSLADRIAIRSGIWWIDPRQTTGHRIGRHLPWEEACFFYLTSLLVAQSYLLLLPEPLR